MITSTKDKPKASLPAGFHIRPATMEDMESTVELLNAFARHYLDVEDCTVDETRVEWQTPGFCLETNTRLVFSPAGTPVGYIEVWDIANPPVHPQIWGRVHPDYEGLGIGTYLMAWAEARARQAIARVPEGARVALRTGAEHSVEPARRLYLKLGWTLIRHTFRMLIEMDSPPPEPQWPKGISLRIADPKGEIEAIYRVDEETFRDHFGYVEEPIEEGLKRFRHYFLNDEASDPSLWFLAMDGEEIAGICLCRKWSYEDRECGYVSSLGVRRPWRKRGVGLALLRHAFRTFYHRGKRKVALHVDAENLTGALRLYQKAGMRIHRQFDTYEKELRPGVELSVQSLNDR